MTDPALLATCWTHAGNVRPGRTADTSPIPIERRIAAVAAAGYAGIGIGAPDLAVARDRLGWPTLRRLLDDAGLSILELEFVNDWWAADARRAASDAERALVLEAAAALGAHHIKIGGGAADLPPDEAVVLPELERFAAQALEAGTRLALEPGADSALRDYERSIRLVSTLAHPGAGMLLDVWHLARVHFEMARLPLLLRPELLVTVELSDGDAQPIGSIFEDTFDHRLLPGQGSFDTAGFVRAVRELGFEGPWGVELMSDAFRALPVDELLAQARDAAREVLA